MEASGVPLAMSSVRLTRIAFRMASLATAAMLMVPASQSTAAQAANASAQAPVTPQPAPGPPAGKPETPVIPAGVPVTPDYVIGPDDILTVIVWREKDMSGDVAVRPDGKISLPLVNDVQAAGLTPEQLRVQLTEATGKFVEDPNVTVVVKAINSRKVFVTGQVGKPGPYPLMGSMTVLQVLSLAGGILEYADAENISVLRSDGGKQQSYRFNYKEVSKRKNLQQNIELRPGDTIVVP
jgi:polysaccharide export outer membrane protein